MTNLEYLKKHLQKEFYYYFESDPFVYERIRRSKPVENFYGIPSKNIAYIINTSFVWADSKLGQSFWKNFCDRILKGEINTSRKNTLKCRIKEFII